MKRGSLAVWLPIKLLALILCLVGCAPIIRTQQGILTTTVSLGPQQPLGQSLKANYAGLSGVSVYINPQTSEPATGTLRFHLKSDPNAAAELAQTELPLSQVTKPAYYRFQFASQPASNQTDYFFFVELDGTGQLELGSAPSDAYIDGSLYADGNPAEGQLAFQLSYSPVPLAGGLLVEAAGWIGILLAAVFLLVLPGWALLAAFLPEWSSLGWPEKLALAAGASLPLYPVLFLWGRLVGIYPGAAWAWAPASIAGVYLGWKAWRMRSGSFPSKLLASMRSWRGSDVFWPNFVFALTLLVIFGVRLWGVRNLDVPLWGDSYQHTVIAQRMLENGGLFDSWEPYAPYESLTVQFGFPALAALWSWLTGADTLRSTLVVGQVTNGLAVLALYPLALWVSRGNRWSGNFSLMAAGLLMQIPAFYVNWGRYAQLSGQAILPAAVVLLLYLALRRGRVGPGEIVLNAVVLAGMLLHYYRMAFYYITFLPVLLVLVIPLFKARAFSWSARLLALVASAGLAVALLLPWMSNVMGSNLTGMVERGVTNTSPAETILRDYYTWLEIPGMVPGWLLAAAGIALMVSLVMRRWMVSSLLLWVVLLAAFRLGMFIGLPGANMMQSFAVLIFMYVPISLLCGWLVGEMTRISLSRWPKLGALGLVVGLPLLFVYGLTVQKSIVDPRTYAIVTRPDLRAMAWIRANTGETDLFLVEGFSIYQGFTAVGSDGGWWIPLLAGRHNTMPPQYALINERPAEPDYTQRVVHLVKTLEANPVLERTSLALLCEWGVRYIYVGQKQGLASVEQQQLFSPVSLNSLPLKYAQDRVRIYELPAESCRE